MVYWTNDMTEYFVWDCLLKVQTFFDLIKNSAGKWFMNGLIKLPKRWKNYLRMDYSVKKTPEQ